MSPAGLLLAPLAWVYGGLIAARNRWYDDPRHVARVHAPVISVGNLTTGGTGKTPVVIEVARQLAALGRRPAVLTRGYRGTPEQPADEVLELRESLPGVSVLPNPDRLAEARVALTAQAADAFVLDDGFQHRRLHRDLDLVLIDALNPWGGGWLLPAGRLREPVSGLRRAGAVLITRANQVSAPELSALRHRAGSLAPQAQILTAAVRAAAACDLNARPVALAELSGKPLVTLCGLGNPRTFERLAADGGADVRRALRFGDHWRYRPADVAGVMAAAQRCGAAAVLTTRKDWVKLRALWPADGLPLIRLDLGVDIEPRGAFDALVRQAVAAETR